MIIIHIQHIRTIYNSGSREIFGNISKHCQDSSLLALLCRRIIIKETLTPAAHEQRGVAYPALTDSCFKSEL